MYLGMTEDDFLNVYNDTPKIVGKRVGVSEENLNENENTLLDSIRDKDAIAFAIMNDFRTTYKEWWDTSKNFPTNSDEQNFYAIKNKLEKLILKRDEIRKALVSYLNFKYGKAND